MWSQCRNAILISTMSFQSEHEALQGRIVERAERDGDIFVPNLPLSGPVEHVLICMEPSLGAWARDAQAANAQIAAGFRNFVFSMEDFILHYAAGNYLCKPGERYQLTDVSKGAMLVKRAEAARTERYDRWYPLLLDEIELVAPTGNIIAVGSAVARQLVRRGFARAFAQVIHFSSQAGSSRKAAVRGRENDFNAFQQTVTHEHIIEYAAGVMRQAKIAERFYNATITRLRRGQWSLSRQQLLFAYKTVFADLNSTDRRMSR